jgi:hypothetical protein
MSEVVVINDEREESPLDVRMNGCKNPKEALTFMRSHFFAKVCTE